MLSMDKAILKHLMYISLFQKPNADIISIHDNVFGQCGFMQINSLSPILCLKQKCWKIIFFWLRTLFFHHVTCLKFFSQTLFYSNFLLWCLCFFSFRLTDNLSHCHLFNFSYKKFFSNHNKNLRKPLAYIFHKKTRLV